LNFAAPLTKADYLDFLDGWGGEQSYKKFHLKKTEIEDGT
jgi:hypothetical protein